MSFVRWGLIPWWAKDSSVAAKMINARSETASMKPAFRDALKCRRCLIPADAFYESKRIGKSKQPYCFEVNEGKLFAFAGIWDRWKNASGNQELCNSSPRVPFIVATQAVNRFFIYSLQRHCSVFPTEFHEGDCRHPWVGYPQETAADQTLQSAMTYVQSLLDSSQ